MKHDETRSDPTNRSIRMVFLPAGPLVKLVGTRGELELLGHLLKEFKMFSGVAAAQAA